MLSGCHKTVKDGYTYGSISETSWLTEARHRGVHPERSHVYEVEKHVQLTSGERFVWGRIDQEET